MSLINTYSLTRDDEEPTKQNFSQQVNQESTWQSEYREAICDIHQLCKELDLNIEDLPFNTLALENFPLRVPYSYLERIQKANANDPLLLQILPHQLELQTETGFSTDPVGDLKSIKTKGLIQKYHGRALLLASSCCAIHCRYCFRRHFPYSEQNPRHDGWLQAIEELKKNDEINEVILSGGDPLVLEDSYLRKLVNKISCIPHITTLRIHTRVPVAIPNRICDSLLSWMKNTRLKLVMILHINHAQEINHELQSKLTLLSRMNCLLLNQSVLLRNINADTANLVKLSKELFNAGVTPYYLHLLDKVAGAAHFDIPENDARDLMREVSKQLPGYLVPKLVKEVAGEDAKRIIDY